MEAGCGGEVCHFEGVPTELMHIILTECSPSYMLVIFLFVCKQWYKIIRDALVRYTLILPPTTLDGFKDNPRHKKEENKRKREMKTKRMGRFAVAVIENTTNPLTLLQWAHSQGLYHFNASVMVAAMKGLHLSSIEWLLEKEKRCRLTPKVFNVAGGMGRVDLMQWLLEKGFPFKPSTLCDAARAGHMNALEWGLEKAALGKALGCGSGGWTIGCPQMVGGERDEGGAHGTLFGECGSERRTLGDCILSERDGKQGEIERFQGNKEAYRGPIGMDKRTTASIFFFLLF